MNLAFALWAEGLAACVSSQQQPHKQPKDKQERAAGSKQAGSKGSKKGKRPAGGDAAAEAEAEEETATSSGAGGKARPSKKAKA